MLGNLAPGGVIKHASREALFSHRGRAVVFDSLDDLAARIDAATWMSRPMMCWCCAMQGPAVRRECRRPATSRFR